MELTSRTLLSLHVVAMLVGLAVWITRLSDKVDELDKAVAELRHERQWK